MMLLTRTPLLAVQFYNIQINQALLCKVLQETKSTHINLMGHVVIHALQFTKYKK